MRKNRKQQINNCKMSSQSPSPTPTFRSQRKCYCKVDNLTAMTALTFCVFLVVVFAQGTQAGVIKKREIPFAIDLTPEMVTTTTAPTAAAVVTTIRPVMHDPDIEERESSKTTETTTLPPPPTIAATLAETETNDSVLATRLVLQPAGSVTESSSKEYMLNEIALNETKKLAKSLNEEIVASKQETDITNKTVLVTNDGLETVKAAPNPGVQGNFDSDSGLKAVNTLAHESSRVPRLDETHNKTQASSEINLTNPESGIRAVGNDVAVGNILEKVSNNDKTEQQTGSQEMGNGISLAGFEENRNEQKTKDTLSENLPVKERTEDKEIHTELKKSSEKSGTGSNSLNEQNSEENLPEREKTEGKEIPSTTKTGLENSIALKTESNALNEQSSKENLQGQKSSELQQNHNELKKVLDTSTGNVEIQIKEESLKENHEKTKDQENLKESQNQLKTSPINTDAINDTEFNEQISKENLLPKIGIQENLNETSIKSERENIKTLNTEGNSTHAESSKENIVLKTGNKEIHQDGNSNENNLAKTNTLASKENQTNIAAKPSTITVKDESLETNHISEQRKATTEINLRNQDQTIFSINSEKSHINSEVDTQLNKTEPSSGLHIQDGLDKTVWKDVTNDLPEKTTEKIPKENATLDQNKLEYGRSMFKKAEESETEESFTENSHIANNIDFGDATTGSNNNNNSGERGKKPKFINDNSTNAQQMNLPNNAEVWSLAGMKNLPVFNNTMETDEAKHTTEGRELEELGKAKQTSEQLEIPENKTNLNSPQSEKFLLDWSHIIMDKELVATTAIYEEQQDHNEVNQKLMPQEGGTMSKLNGNPTALEPENKTNNSMLKNLPFNEFSGSTTTTSPSITANSTMTILSAMSDNVVNVEGDKQKIPTTDSFNNETETALKEIEFVGGQQDTSTLSSFSSSSGEMVASPKSVVTHEQLQRPDDTNEINLTLNNNKTTTAEADFTAGEQPNKSVTNLTEIETQTEAERVIALTTPTTAVIEEPNANTTVEPFSTLETGNENVTAKVSSSPTGLEKSQNVKENLENQNESTATDITITTYRPTFWGPITPASPALASSTPDPLTTNSDTPIKQTAITTEKNPLAEVIDQNGNNEIEQKQSINVETTTISSETVGFNNFSSTIKTHLNEQVLLETTTELITTTTTAVDILLTTTAAAETTTTNETLSEKTTSSSKDEIIKEGKEEIHFNETITTEATTTPKNEELLVNEQTELVPETTTETVIVIGSTTSSSTTTTRPPETVTEKSEKEQQEIETTTKAIEADETPVVVHKTQEGSKLTSSDNESFFTTTELPILTTIASKTKDNEDQVKEEEEEDETTTKAVDTYFKFPVKGKGGASRKETEITTTTAATTTATADATTASTSIKEDDRELETTTTATTTTTNMSLIPPPTTTEITLTTTNKEETYISLLDDSTTTTTTTNAPTTTTTAANGEIPTTPSPPLTITTTTTSKNIDISSKIEEIYKVIVSSSTEAAATTTTEPATTTPQGQLTTTRTIFNETTTTTASMIPTKPSPTVITADIGRKTTLPPPINTIMVGNSGNIYPKNTEASSGGTDVNVIIAITVSIIGVIALILLVAFLYLMRKRQKQTSYSQRCRPVSLDEYAIDNGSIGGSIRKGSALRSSKRTYGNLAFDDPSIRHNAMGVHELAKFSSEKLRIFEEFRDVPQITAREDEVPQGCEDKNRYANVLPLPETRVVLQRLNDDDKTEYINANYVTGPKDAPNYYIACQAPLDSTVEDFWRMLWEQQSRVIIQATDLIENGVEKCAEYLPPSVTLDNHSTFGDFQVTLQNREVKDKYAISTLILKHTGENNATRELTHFWYKWPETGVPVEEAPIIAMLLEARSSLISYAIEQANEDKENSSGGATLKSAEEGTAAPITNTTNGSSGKEGGNVNGEINGNISMVPIKKTARNQGPLTIHCSPGTGRTGTIIACDIALRSLETPKRTVDIPHIVYYVRRGRASAVLTKEQYEFIYKVANMYAAKISNPTNYN